MKFEKRKFIWGRTGVGRGPKGLVNKLAQANSYVRDPLITLKFVVESCKSWQNAFLTSYTLSAPAHKVRAKRNLTFQSFPISRMKEKERKSEQRKSTRSLDTFLLSCHKTHYNSLFHCRCLSN